MWLLFYDFFHVFSNLNTKYLLLTDDEGGGKLPDGNWTGMIGMVKRLGVDIAIAGIPER